MKRIIVATLFINLFALIAFSQSTTGRLSGNVSGPDGLIPGATVTISDQQTGREQTTTTNSVGAYLFERVPFGNYTVRVSQDGFKTYVGTDVKVDANTEYTLSPQLELGDVNVEVQVTAGADLVNSSDGALSTTVDSKQILDLPINGRNPLSLLNLQAGVNATSNSITGQRSSSVNYTRDGINVQDNFIRTGGFVQDRPSVDDTGEFSVTTQNAGAELGGGASAQVQLITPRGGNEFHGAGYIYNRNSYFSANEFGNNAQGVEKPFLNRNQVGGKISGPLPIPGFGEGTPYFFKDKGFFFFNYERYILRQKTSKTVTTMLSDARQGLYTYTGLDGVARTVNVLDGTGFASAIPTANGGALSGVDPTIQARFLDRAPTTGNGLVLNGGISQQLLFNQQNNDTRNAFTMRFDGDINDNNSVYFVYKFNDNADDRTDIDTTFNVEPVNTQGGPTSGYLVAWNSVIGSSFTNEVRFAFNQSAPFFNEDPNLPSDFLINGAPYITNPQSNFQAQGRATDQITIQDLASYTTGDHTLRFGADIAILKIDSETNFNRVPLYTIQSGNTITPELPVTIFAGGASAADRARMNRLRWFLGGFVGAGSVAANFAGIDVGPQLGGSSLQNFRYQTYGLYFQDSWRATPELSLNLGVRWDYYSPLVNPEVVYLEPDFNGATDKQGAVDAILNPNGQYVFLGTNSGNPGQFFRPDYNNFGPVVSFAWSPRDRGSFIQGLFGNSGVLRGGFRVGYINDEYVLSSFNAAGANPGLDLTSQATQNGSVALNARFSTGLPGFTLPTFTPPPISFATANTNAGNFFNTVFAIQPDLEMQQNYQYSFGFSREIGFDTAIEVRYVGGQSSNMVRGIDYNQMDIVSDGYLTDFQNARNNCRIFSESNGLTLSDGCFDPRNNGLAGQVDLPFFAQLPFGGLLTNGTIRNFIQTGQVGQMALIYVLNGLNGSFPFRANENAGVVDMLQNQGKYNYNSLQAEVRKRFTKGLAFQANYVFSKVLSDIPGDGQSRFDPLLDFARPELEYNRADYDRTHTVNINVNYELPFGKGKPFLNYSGWADKFVGGWQATSIINYSSGVPISVEFNGGTLNRSGRSSRQTANSSLSLDEIRNLVGINYGSDGTVYYIDQSVISSLGNATGGNVETSNDGTFADQVFFQPGAGETGLLPRNFLDGPSYFNVNFGFIKNTRFGERYNLQIRAEAFNLLNSTRFFISQSSNIFEIRNGTFGIIGSGSTYSSRLMQFAMRFEF